MPRSANLAGPSAAGQSAAVNRPINKMRCCGGGGWVKLEASQGRNAMPRPSVAEKRATFRKLHDSGRRVIPEPVGRGLRAVPAGARLQGAGVDIVGFCMGDRACRQCGRRRHGAGASEGDLRRDRCSGERGLRGWLCGRSGGRCRERHALLRDRRRGPVDRGFPTATRTSRSTTFRSRSNA